MRVIALAVNLDCQLKGRAISRRQCRTARVTPPARCRRPRSRRHVKCPPKSCVRSTKPLSSWSSVPAALSTAVRAGAAARARRAPWWPLGGIRNHGLGLPSGASRPLACSSTAAISAIVDNSAQRASKGMSASSNCVAGQEVTRSTKATLWAPERLSGGRRR